MQAAWTFLQSIPNLTPSGKSLKPSTWLLFKQADLEPRFLGALITTHIVVEFQHISHAEFGEQKFRPSPQKLDESRTYINTNHLKYSKGSFLYSNLAYPKTSISSTDLSSYKEGNGENVWFQDKKN